MTRRALGFEAYGPMPQGEFLLKLGLGERRDRLLGTGAPEQRDGDLSPARPGSPTRAQMGVLFKVLALDKRRACPAAALRRHLT